MTYSPDLLKVVDHCQHRSFITNRYTGHRIAEIKEIIENQYQRALRILSENSDKLHALSNKLLEKEVIFREDLEEIFGKRAWDPELTEKPLTSLTEKENTVENTTEDKLENKEEKNLTSTEE